MKKTIFNGLIAIAFLLSVNTLKAEKSMKTANSNLLELSTENSVELNNIIISKNLEIDNTAYEDAQDILVNTVYKSETLENREQVWWWAIGAVICLDVEYNSSKITTTYHSNGDVTVKEEGSSFSISWNC